MAEHFFIGYTGNRNLKESDFSKYSLQELKNMMKSQAKRLNTRLATLEKNSMKTGYAYQQAKLYAFDRRQYMRSQDQPRFETAVNVYEEVDGGIMKTRERTREEIIEQLMAMGKWESYTTSTVSGMMETYEAKYEEMKKHGYEKSFEEFVNVVTADAYEIIRSYYGSDTADVIVSSYSEQAVDAFIAAHPDLFSKANPFNSQGGLLEGYFENWYNANWENTAETISDEEAEESVMDIGY